MPYAVQMRAQPGQFLAEAELRRNVPSLYCTRAHPSRSSQYVQLTSADIIYGMMNEGLGVVSVKAAGTKKSAVADYVKHEIRFRPVGQTLAVGDIVYEAILVNSHDGNSAWTWRAGAYKQGTRQNFVVPFHSDPQNYAHVIHRGAAVEKVVAAYNQTRLALADTLEIIRLAQRTVITPDEEKLFAEECRLLRFPEEAAQVPVYDVIRAWTVDQEAERTAWHAFEKVQMNLVEHGGVRVTKPTTRHTWSGRIRTHSRPVKGIDDNLRLNAGLWALMEETVNFKLTHR